MESYYVPEILQDPRVSSTSDFVMDAQFSEKCHLGHWVNTENCETCWREEEDRKLQNDESGMEVYRWAVRCRYRIEDMERDLPQLEKEDKGGSNFLEFQAFLENSREYLERLEALWWWWKEPVQDPHVSSTTGGVKTSQGEEPSAYHGFDKIRSAMGYFCLCGVQHDDEHELLLHVRYAVNHDDGVAVCGFCGEMQDDFQELEEHLSYVHGRPMWELWKDCEE